MFRPCQRFWPIASHCRLSFTNKSYRTLIFVMIRIDHAVALYHREWPSERYFCAVVRLFGGFFSKVRSTLKQIGRNILSSMTYTALSSQASQSRINKQKSQRRQKQWVRGRSQPPYRQYRANQCSDSCANRDAARGGRRGTFHDYGRATRNDDILRRREKKRRVTATSEWSHTTRPSRPLRLLLDSFA